MASSHARNTVIVVPCYDEAARLAPAEFARFADAHAGISFVLVDDGSTDGTAAIISTAARDHASIRCVVLPTNVGKAEAVRAGVLSALESSPDFVGYWDADLATPLDAIAIMQEILEQRQDVALVLGSRILMLGRTIRRSASRHYLGRMFSTAVSLVTGIQVYDSQCGAKLMRGGAFAATVFDRPFVSRWLFDVEILLRMRALDGSLERAYECPLPRWLDVGGSKVRRTDFARATVELARLHHTYIRQERGNA